MQERLRRVIGEDELSASDKAIMKFGTMFEKYFLNQGFDENRSMDETLDLAWDLLSLLPASELDRVNEQLIKRTLSPRKMLRDLYNSYYMKGR